MGKEEACSEEQKNWVCTLITSERALTLRSALSKVQSAL
jgi:hypothetical protein